MYVYMSLSVCFQALRVEARLGSCDCMPRHTTREGGRAETNPWQKKLSMQPCVDIHYLSMHNIFMNGSTFMTVMFSNYYQKTVLWTNSPVK